MSTPFDDEQLEAWLESLWPRSVKDQEALTARAMLKRGYHKGRAQLKKEILEWVEANEHQENPWDKFKTIEVDDLKAHLDKLV